MKRLFTAALGAVLLMGLTACGGPEIEDYAANSPELELEQFLSGRLTAHGVFEDRFGNMRRSFVVDILGEWDEAAQRLTLTEDFVYEDGSTEQRIWRLDKAGPEDWTGAADGVIGTASGREAGNAFNWVYTIDLRTPDGEMRVSFDDWMWQIDDSVMVNRAFVTKWGVEIGQVSIFFRRETPLPAG